MLGVLENFHKEILLLKIPLIILVCIFQSKVTNISNKDAKKVQHAIFNYVLQLIHICGNKHSNLFHCM